MSHFVMLCSEGRGRLRVMSIVTSLSMMSAGKFVDKLKCMLCLLVSFAFMNTFICTKAAVTHTHTKIRGAEVDD